MAGDQERYSVVFAGELAEGSRREDVQAELARRFKMPPEKVARLFTGAPITVRRDLARSQAESLKAAFAQAGARCRIELLRSGPVAAPASAPPNTAADAAPAPQMAPSKKTAAPTPAPGGDGFLLNADTLERCFVRLLDPARGERVPLLLRRLRVAAVLALPALYPLSLAVLSVVALGGVLRPLSGGRSIGEALLLDLFPALAALLALAWLARPLLARRRDTLGEEIDAERAPLLHLLSAHLADQLGAPPVDVIVVDGGLRVRARQRLLPRRQLRLHIGLPLLVASDSRQLAGAIAQALASAAPAHTPLALQLLEDSLAWLRRSAEREGRLDRRLMGWAEELAGPPARAAGLALRVLRAPNAALRQLGRLASVSARPLLRRRESEVFSVQLQLTGSEAGVAALHRRRLLAHAREELRRELVQGEQELLSEDFPALMIWLSEQREAQWRRQVEAELADPARRRRGLADAERIAAAQAAALPPGFLDASPARSLLTDYAALARQFSLRYYRALGLQLEATALVPPPRAQSALVAQRQAETALQEYFLGYWLAGQVVVPAGLAEARALGQEERVQRLQEAVAQVRQVVPEMANLSDYFPPAALALAEAELAAVAAKYRADPTAEETLRRRRAAFAKLDAERKRCAELQARRLELGLAEAVALATDKTKLAVEAKTAASTLAGLSALEPELAACRRDIALLRHLTVLRRKRVKLSEQLFLTQTSNAWHRLDQLHNRLANVRLSQGVLLDRVRLALPELPANATSKAMQEHLVALDAMLERVRQRQIGRLAWLAGGAEARHGIRVKLLG